MNTKYVYQSSQVGEFRLALLTGTGPASYSALSGDILYNPGSSEYINFPSDCTTLSGNYSLTAIPTAINIRAGAPSPNQSGWRWLWKYSGLQGVTTVVQNAAGTGMTPGTYALSPSGGGGTGFAGTVTVTATDATAIVITNHGAGYTSAPTITAATGGTPLTFTVSVAAASGNVANTTNLSAEVVQFGAIVSQL